MALPLQAPIEIPLGGGVDQATGELFRGPNILEASVNGDHDKRGYLKKARGFTRIALTATTHGGTPEALYISVGTDRGELVLLGKDNVYGIAAPSAVVDGAALVLRGPSLVGNYRAGVVHVSSIAE